MKSLCTSALALLLSLGWAGSAADAQTGGHYGPTLTPLPAVAQVSSSHLVPAGYYTTDPASDQTPTPADAAPTPHPPAERFNSAFTTPTRAYDEPADATSDVTDSAQPMTEYEQALYDTCWGDADSCGVAAHCGCGGGFFGVLGGVVMTRARGPSDTTTYQGTTFDTLMTFQDANAGWTGGGEVTLGYAFGGSANPGPWGASGACAGPAVAFTWWGTGVAATALNSSFGLLGTTIDGNPASFYFEDASSQRIFRTDIVNSFEANLLSGTLISTTQVQVIGLVGFRYFRFTEDLIFGSVTFGSDWGDNGGADEAYMRFRSTNNLYGGQLGAIFNWLFAPRWSLYITPKAGIYGNQMAVRSRLYAGNGVSTYDFTRYKSDVAFLGQIDTGFTYLIRHNLSAYAGYRIVGASNLAIGEHQFAPTYGDVKQSGSLILHGVTFGVVGSY